MWDDEIETPPPIKDNSTFSSHSGGFSVGRGRGFSNLSSLNAALPQLGSVENISSKANNSGWNEDDPWVENNTANENSNDNNSWKNNNRSDGWGSSDNNYRPRTNNQVCYNCGQGGHNSKNCFSGSNNFSAKKKGCFKCGEDGHISRDCPSGNRGGGKGRACFKCNEEGHMSRDCPKEGRSNRTQSCFKCGEDGHMARDCSNSENRSSQKYGEERYGARDFTQSGGGRGRECHKCGEEGHMARDCPSAGDDRKSKGCFKCGEDGHISRDCPSAGDDRKSKGCFKCGEDGHISRDCPNPESKTGPDGKVRAPLYIPPDPSDDAETVFASVPAGINFSKYESTPVDVTGCDPNLFITSFQAAGLNKHLLGNITRSGYEVPTPIQKYAIPIVMQGKDLMGCAQTGSGKTAAFLLPILHNMLTDPNLPDNIDREEQEPLALVLAPTRELAMQIMTEARKFAYDSIVKAEVVYGGTSTSYQISRLKRGVHILVATPGRLNDLVEKGKVSFAKLKYLVLDEADRMLDMGFMPAVQKMVALMPSKEERRTLMFSATFPEDIQRIAAEFLDNSYVFITVGKVGGANADVTQTFFKLGQYEKRQKLMDILQESGTDRVLVFVEQKRTADFLASYTSQKDIPTTSIHGDRLQKEREEALRDFRKGRMPVLVATAVAARGLDIKDVCHVINYDLPQSIDEYVHRIGRTGRLGNLGKATSFYDADVDQPLSRSLKKILMDAQQEIPDWLHEEANNATGTVPQYSRGNFGGRDFRNQGKPRSAQASNDAWEGNYAQTSESTYSQPVASDEFWD